MLFYPKDAHVPTELRTDEFLLEPLSPAHVELDYAALMDSKEMLRRWSQSDWPADDFTLADNLEDLEMHDQEHRERTAFTYTVLDPSGSECLGCVYIQPMAPLYEQEDARAAPEGGDYRARVAFWVRQPRLADDLDRRLLRTLIDWFAREWAFSRVVFSTSALDARQLQVLADAGLSQIYVKEIVDETAGDVERRAVFG